MKTRRILLKKFSKNDINLIMDLDGDSDVMKYITLGKARSFDEIKKKSFPRILNSYSNGEHYGIFAAYLNLNQTFIGWFQFEKDRDIKNAIEVGWRLKKEFWGNGYATEVGLALVDKGLKLNKKIVARAMKENVASINVMEKIGLQFVKEFYYKPDSNTPDVLYEKNQLI
jgi:RimJ/RimL family protein N-acetyltransferase